MPTQPSRTTTRVAIVGAGPAGLVLSHLLAEAGIESVVLDKRSREQIESTIRAGILEHGSAELLASIGTTSRVRTLGDSTRASSCTSGASGTAYFSWWMTSMLHLSPEMGEFDRMRQLGELRTVVESEAGRRYLAEAYTGWPFETSL